jgi:predicted enzyme related to lactoylglutathione lyase
MSDTRGRFVWYELMTTDTSAARAFYRQVAGWGTQDAAMAGMDYSLFTLGELPIGGLMALPEEARASGAPPSWTGYVAVDDVDASAAQAKRLGGTIYVEPQDIPGVGRFAVIADPQGASLAIYKTADPDQETPLDPMSPGRIGWHELNAADWESAFPFYQALFGWKKDEAVPMGEMGTYQLFTAGGPATGGMFNKPPEVPAPYWLYYINVAGVDAAAARVTAAGGNVLYGPAEVPGDAWVVQAMDPQGAMFAMVGKRG